MSSATLIRATARRGGSRVALPSEKPSEHRGFRPDIEGLRAVAVGTVLLYHAGIPFMPGGFIGVDVFFVISGFLITGVILGEMRSTGRVRLRTFYIRRAKRLLPATMLVLGSVGALSYLFLPKTRWIATGGDIVASALYGVNWRLADRAVDYLSADKAPSAVQHFWSLSVEEQFYFVWPFLLLLATARARRRKRSLDRPLLIAMFLIFVPSLAWSIYLTAANPERAYFVTTTRMWELALGGGLAIVIAHTERFPRWFAFTLGWVGLGTILATAVILTTSVPFPGAVALVPTLGAAAVIASGRAAGACGPVMLLGRRPMVFMGGLSYSLYLWHWPLLVISGTYQGEKGVALGVTVAVLSIVPAYLAFRLVENPIRLSTDLLAMPGRVGMMALNCTAGAAVVGMLLMIVAGPTSPPGGAFTTSIIPASGGKISLEPAPGQPQGANALSANPENDPAGQPVDSVADVVPSPANARDDRPVDQPKGCTANARQVEVTVCTYGDAASDKVVTLAGDSHAQQWIPALNLITRQRGLKLEVYTKANCSFTTQEVYLPVEQAPYPQCLEWSRALRTLLGAKPPRALFVSAEYRPAVVDGKRVDDRDELIGAGMREAWAPAIAAGVPVITVLDTPRPPFDVPECVAGNTTSLRQCSFSRAKALRRTGSGALQYAAAGLRGVTSLDLRPAVCPSDPCAAVIGNVLVYRDTNHVSATYSRTTAPRWAATFDALGFSEP